MTCEFCGGTHVLPAGGACPHCIDDTVFEITDYCLTIPHDYRGVQFNREALPDDLGEEYKATLDKVYKRVIDIKNSRRNYLIASPAKHGKSILCYSAIQILYQQHIPTFPLLDIGEMRRLMIDMELGSTSYVLEDMDAVPAFIYTAPILFVRIPNMITFTTIDTILTLLDRRTRRSNATVFIYNGCIEEINKIDKYNKLKSLFIDGTSGTLIVKSFRDTSIAPREESTE